MPDFDSFEYNRHIKDILITENEIKSKIRETADKISSDYSGKPLLLVSILNGAFIFMADFCRALTIPCTVGFIVGWYFN